MKVVVLTTETLHHTYFIRELHKVFPIEKVFAETDQIHPTFEVHHPFEDEREAFECETFFNGKKTKLEDVSNVLKIKNINDPESIAALKQIAPEMTIVFGTRKLSSELLKIIPPKILNLHGGDPEEYRGLDSHLWSIYHGDFKFLVTTLHHLNERLDDGYIIGQKPMTFKRGMGLHEMRRLNTENCLNLTIEALNEHQKSGQIVSRAQKKQGRYYSFMPSALKEICCVRFKKYTDTL
jgi:methionyl-tRNA formyltransferase